MTTRILVCSVLALASVSAEAAVVVDQSALLTATTGTNFASSVVQRRVESVAQSRIQSMSVTAGKTGRLAQVDVQVYQLDGTADLSVNIASGIAGQPGYLSLGTFIVPRSAVPTSAQAYTGALVSVDVSSLAFDVVPGTVFSILLDATGQQTGTNRFGWVFAESADGSDFNLLQTISYASGYNQISTNNGASWSISGADRTFRTWVDTGGAVPEPGSWALLIAGFGLTGAALRRRRTAAA